MVHNGERLTVVVEEKYVFLDLDSAESRLTEIRNDSVVALRVCAKINRKYIEGLDSADALERGAFDLENYGTCVLSMGAKWDLFELIRSCKNDPSHVSSPARDAS